MVDVKVFTDQYGKIDAVTEKRIKALLGNAKVVSQQQAKVLQSIIDESIREVKRLQTLEQALAYSTSNPFTTTAATETLIKYQENVAKMFKFGLKFTNKTPSSTVKLLEEGVKQSTMQWITGLGDDLKTRAGEIVADGISKSIPVNDIVAKLEEQLQITRSRANSIARTETMRAAHAGSYGQAIRDGKQYYVIDSRAEACTYCKKRFTDEVFDITDPGPMPPAHPNCACIPIYFDSYDDAVRWAGKISRDIAHQEQQLLDQGKIIKPDGTGTEVNKLNPKKRLKN